MFFAVNWSVPFFFVTYFASRCIHLPPFRFCSITATTTGTKGTHSGWAAWPLFVIPKLLCCASAQARWNLHPYLIFTYELMIPLWADCGLPNTLGGAARRWWIVLVGYWLWWLIQYDTWLRNLIAASSWMGHKPTEPYWPWVKWKKKSLTPTTWPILPLK